MIMNLYKNQKIKYNIKINYLINHKKIVRLIIKIITYNKCIKCKKIKQNNILIIKLQKLIFINEILYWN